MDAGGIRFITAGGAGALFDSPDATPNPWTLVYYVGLSFAVIDVDGARKVFKLVDALEDSDDVQNVYTNVDLSDEVLAALDEE